MVELAYPAPKNVFQFAAAYGFPFYAKKGNWKHTQLRILSGEIVGEEPFYKSTLKYEILQREGKEWVPMPGPGKRSYRFGQFDWICWKEDDDDDDDDDDFCDVDPAWNSEDASEGVADMIQFSVSEKEPCIYQVYHFEELDALRPVLRELADRITVCTSQTPSRVGSLLYEMFLKDDPEERWCIILLAPEITDEEEPEPSFIDAGAT